ncbi:MAG: hypothetical protein R3B09_29040 [Nannocystaceae bacterium]
MSDATQPMKALFGPRMQTVLGVVHMAAGTLDAANKRRIARIAARDRPAPAQRSPLEAALAASGLEIDNFEGVLGTMLGDTPDAKRQASLLMSRADAAPLFHDFATRCAAWAPPSTPGEGAASSSTTGTASSAPPESAGPSPSFGSTAAASTNGWAAVPPGLAYPAGPIFHAPHAQRHQPPSVAYATPFAGWPTFRPDFVLHAPAAVSPLQASYAGTPVQDAYAHVGGPGGPPRYLGPPPAPTSRTKPRPGWNGLGKLPTRPRADLSTRLSDEKTDHPGASVPRGAATSEPAQVPESETSDAADSGLPVSSPEAARCDARGIVSLALVDWMKAKLDALEREKAADIAERAELQRRLVEVTERLARLERLVAATTVAPASTSEPEPLVAAVETDAAAPSDVADLEIQLPEASTDVEIVAPEVAPSTNDEPVVTVAVEVPAEASDVDEEVASKFDASKDVAAEIVDGEREEIADVGIVEAEVTSAKGSTSEVISSKDDHRESTCRVSEPIADDAEVVDTADVAGSGPEARKADDSEPSDVASSDLTTAEETADDASFVLVLDEPPGPIPPELIDTVRRIQLLEQQSKADRASRTRENAHISELNQRAEALEPTARSNRCG